MTNPVVWKIIWTIKVYLKKKSPQQSWIDFFLHSVNNPLETGKWFRRLLSWCWSNNVTRPWSHTSVNQKSMIIKKHYNRKTQMQKKSQGTGKQPQEKYSIFMVTFFDVECTLFWKFWLVYSIGRDGNWFSQGFWLRKLQAPCQSEIQNNTGIRKYFNRKDSNAKKSQGTGKQPQEKYSIFMVTFFDHFVNCHDSVSRMPHCWSLPLLICT